MAAPQVHPPTRNQANGSPEALARRITPRRGLPGGRAVVGGLLVAVAAVGIFAAVAGVGGGPATSYVVAARDIAPGATLTTADLEMSAIDLPADQRSHAFTEIGQLTGAVAVGPLSAGELIQSGGLAEGVDASVPTLSVSLPEANANAGDLQRGDTVQVFATYGSDASGTTVRLAPEATVVSIDAGDETVATGGEVLLRLAVPSPEERTAILNAAVTGELALVRTTGAEDALSTDEPFRPDEALGLGEDTSSSAAEDSAPSTTEAGS